MDRKLYLKMNVFYADWEDKQFGSIDSGIFNSEEDSEMYGFELESSYKITDEITIWANCGYIETELGDTGEEFTKTPDFTSSLGASYLGQNGIYGSVNWSHQANTKSALVAGETVPSLNLVSGRVGYKFDQFDVYLYGKNLLDEDVIYDYSDRDNGTDLDYNIGQPRTYGVGMTYRW